MDDTADPAKSPAREVVLLAAGGLIVMAGATIVPALPALSAAFRDSPDVGILVPHILTIPGLLIAATAPVMGVLVDRFGRKPILILSIVLYGLSGSSGVWLDTLWGLLIGRAALGIAVAGVMTCTVTLIADYFGGAERERFMGFQAAASGITGAVFVSVGGILADLSWRAPFFAYLVAFLILPGAILGLEEPPRPRRSNGAADAARGNAIPWPTVLLLYALAMVGMTLIYLVPLKLPFYLKGLSGASGAEVGLVIGGTILLSAGVSLLYGRIRRLASYQAIFAVQFVLIGLGFGLLAVADRTWVVLIGMAACGVGFGLEVPNVNVWLAAVAPAHARGRLIGGVTTCFYLGQFVSPFVAGLLATSEGLEGIAGMYRVAGLASALIGLGFVVSILSRRAKGRPD